MILNEEMELSYLHNRSPAKQKLASIRRTKRDNKKNAVCLESLPKVDSLHTNRAVPQALEGVLLLSSTGLGALPAEALGTRPAEWRGGIAECKASVVHEAETHARRHGDSWDGGSSEREDGWMAVIGGRGSFPLGRLDRANNHHNRR